MAKKTANKKATARKIGPAKKPCYLVSINNGNSGLEQVYDFEGVIDIITRKLIAEKQLGVILEITPLTEPGTHAQQRVDGVK